MRISNNNKSKGEEDDNNSTNNKKKIIRSIQIDPQLWSDFDKWVINEYGEYKKSLVIEFLIRQYMNEKNKIKENNNSYGI